MPPSKPQEVSPRPSQPLAGAGELFHTACDTHTDKGICCSEPAPPASLMLAAVQTRARKAGRVRSGRRVSGMVLLPRSRASEAAVLWTPAGSQSWRGCGKRKGRKRGKVRPGEQSRHHLFPAPKEGDLADPKTSAPLGVVRQQHCGSPHGRRSDLNSAVGGSEALPELLLGPCAASRRPGAGRQAGVRRGSCCRRRASAGAGGSRLSLLAALPLLTLLQRQRRSVVPAFCIARPCV